MIFNTFGKTGWRVGALGIGTWQMGAGWGDVDDQESVQTLLFAWENGVNFVDSALAYGDGHSHEVIARALQQWNGEKIFIATKIPPVGDWPDAANDNPPMRGRYPRWYVRQKVELCLKQLGVERLDLLQLHCWLPDGALHLDWLESLNELRLEGKIDHIGVSLRDNRPEEGVELAKLGLVASQQVVYNLFDQRAQDALFPAGAATGTAFIARVPLDSSALTGTWTRESFDSWPQNDIRRALFRGERFARTLTRVESLKESVTPYFADLTEAAMRFALAGATVVIPGMKTRDEVRFNLCFADGKTFPAPLAEALQRHRWARNFYI